MALADNQPLPPTVLDSILAQLPWLVLFLILWIVLFWIIRRSSRRTAEETKRSEAHAKAIEAKLDQILEQNRRDPSQAGPASRDSK
jgi:flagellar biosynthesis/type III secretory pathway M-ring protein FliF/YscJ